MNWGDRLVEQAGAAGGSCCCLALHVPELVPPASVSVELAACWWPRPRCSLSPALLTVLPELFLGWVDWHLLGLGHGDLQSIPS